tara:strand:- start:2066 stop:3004 length:939 start_codon:yes stop_codon:yes gene_type:complete
MAINVNTVYQTVLLILNKEQRGYMTPLEFNKIGTQVQLEIFENYFESLNQQLRVPQADTDYSDRVVNIDEATNVFKEYSSATYDAGSKVFNLPTQSGAAAVNQNFTQNAAGTQTDFTLITINASQVANGTHKVFVNGIEQAVAGWTLTGLELVFAIAPAADAVILLQVTPNDFYRLGGVFYTPGAIQTQELERVTRSDLFHLNSSNLTKPSKTYPIYVYEQNKITVYPTSIISDLSVAWLRKPMDVIWNFTSGSAGQYQYNSATSTDFELIKPEQTEVITKILLYAGVVIQNPEIIQVAASQIAQQNNNSKS